MAQIHVQYQAPVFGPNGVAPGPGRPQFMLTSLYVEDSDTSVTDEQLFQMFSQVAQVALERVCRDLATGRSIGYGMSTITILMVETKMFKRLKKAGKHTKMVEQSGSSDDKGTEAVLRKKVATALA
ncbi:hypothetical protein GOBAR_AA17443 [Gossypium barbadense]|uniref:RRM domain-containing protein n=1 Tax=Gossypium barbadense TaxID=3634 RepID=A0A2P5XIN6_GOSBA|nr:hypothetical protein GOBAR_AA17443 [Gossypium barbadense]